jgi:hypothetical protein
MSTSLTTYSTANRRKRVRREGGKQGGYSARCPGAACWTEERERERDRVSDGLMWWGDGWVTVEVPVLASTRVWGAMTP